MQHHLFYILALVCFHIRHQDGPALSNEWYKTILQDQFKHVVTRMYHLTLHWQI